MALEFVYSHGGFSPRKMKYNGRIFYDLINLIWSDGFVLRIDVRFSLSISIEIGFYWWWHAQCIHMLSRCVNRFSIGENCNCKMKQFSIISKFNFKISRIRSVTRHATRNHPIVESVSHKKFIRMIFSLWIFEPFIWKSKPTDNSILMSWRLMFLYRASFATGN